MSLFKNKNIWHIQHLIWTDRRSRSGRCLAEVGTQEGSRVLCVPGTSISLHPHISPPPTWWKTRPWKGEDILWPCYFSLVSCLIMCVAGCSEDGFGVNGRWKEHCFSNHLQRVCSSSSIFLIFSCLASSISSFVLLGFLLSLLPPSLFTVCANNSKKIFHTVSFWSTYTIY